MVRPEALDLSPDPDGNATVTAIAFLGPFSRVHCVLADGTDVSAQMSSTAAREFRVGDRVRIHVERSAVLVVPR
jgi:putative spermidine/putrescine transport system ATP-binding protein